MQQCHSSSVIYALRMSSLALSHARLVHRSVRYTAMCSRGLRFGCIYQVNYSCMLNAKKEMDLIKLLAMRFVRA